METTETSVASLIKSDCLITEADEFIGDLYNKDPNHMAKTLDNIPLTAQFHEH